MMKTIEKRKMLKGYVTSGADTGYKKLGFASVSEIEHKNYDNSPDYVGILNLNGIGIFYISLWKGEKVVVVNAEDVNIKTT
jgi:hypothetical protein